MANEASARIKINKLLEESGWRFEDSEKGKANIRLEPGVKYAELGDDFENAETHDKRRGAIDFLLLDEKGYPFIVLEAKSEDKHTLAGIAASRVAAHSSLLAKAFRGELVAQDPNDEPAERLLERIKEPRNLRK